MYYYYLLYFKYFREVSIIVVAIEFFLFKMLINNLIYFYFLTLNYFCAIQNTIQLFKTFWLSTFVIQDQF